MATVEAALFDSGRPILVVPPSAPGPATLSTQTCPSSWPTEFPFAQRTRMDETGMVGVAGMEIGSVLVRASPSLSLIGGPSSTRYCRHGRTPADCGRRPSWSTLGRFPDARASCRPP